MREPLVSVIVPVYRIERYLGLCIESLISQTYKNLEIILVNDGSPDRCPEICDLYAAKDMRIKVIHKVNSGLVSARKAGLQVATGELAAYVDGDDWVEPGFYEELVETMVNTGADLVCAGSSRDLFSTAIPQTNKVPNGFYEGERLQEVKKIMLRSGSFGRIGISTYIWNKLFRTNLLRRFQNSVYNGITICEDAAVVYPYLMASEKVAIVDNTMYHYRQQQDILLRRAPSDYRSEVIGIKALYNTLHRAAGAWPEELGYSAQIDDFILGVCIARSGGLLKPDCLPYPIDLRDRRVVVYSAGVFGQKVVQRLKDAHYARVVAWLDPYYKEYRRCCMDVDPVETIDRLDYDYVLIAAVDNALAEEIRNSLVWRGVKNEKILTVDIPQERREAMLTRYLEF